MIARKYRNRRIGEFLKELKLTEGRNTGVPKIKRALKITAQESQNLKQMIQEITLLLQFLYMMDLKMKF